jgi:hypothetical protein
MKQYSVCLQWNNGKLALLFIKASSEAEAKTFAWLRCPSARAEIIRSKEEKQAYYGEQ